MATIGLVGIDGDKLECVYQRGGVNEGEERDEE